MIDLHTHTLNSDGVLIPTELWRRAQVKGYRYLGITDHVDASNFEEVYGRIKIAAASLNRGGPPHIIPGLEFTHLPPEMIKPSGRPGPGPGRAPYRHSWRDPGRARSPGHQPGGHRG